MSVAWLDQQKQSIEAALGTKGELEAHAENNAIMKITWIWIKFCLLYQFLKEIPCMASSYARTISIVTKQYIHSRSKIPQGELPSIQGYIRYEDTKKHRFRLFP